MFDGFDSNPVADRFPLEELTVGTLVIGAADDPLAPYPFAVKAAERISGGRLVTIDRGGRLFLGQDTGVREENAAFVKSVQPTDETAVNERPTSSCSVSPGSGRRMS